jgi:hypothetical protein
MNQSPRMDFLARMLVLLGCCLLFCVGSKHLTRCTEAFLLC